jgi:hypothetical protein
MTRLPLLLSLACATAAAPAPFPPTPCLVSINDVSQSYDVSVIERPCFTTIYTSNTDLLPVTFRAYPKGAAFMVTASVGDDPGYTFEDYLDFTSGFVFGFFTGDYNAKKKNLTAALTAPLILRPVSPERNGSTTWVGAMALAPSLWPAGSVPPAPTLDNIEIQPFGEVVMASVPAVLSHAPTEDDFRAAFLELEQAVALVALPGTWTINATSPLTPSFNFYYTDAYNGSAWLIEAAAEVFFTP